MKDKYKTLIISCWVVLLCCFVVKLLGGNFFEIVCENEKFIRFCEFIDGNILKYVISFIMYFISGYIYFIAVVKNDISKYKKILCCVLLIVIWMIKLFIYKYQTIAIIVELMLMILTPILLNKKYWKMAIIGYVLNFSFQLLSVFIKNLKLSFIDNNTLNGIIFSIDYYIMIVLFYLYRIKEDNNDGINGFHLFRFRRQRKHQ